MSAVYSPYAKRASSTLQSDGPGPPIVRTKAERPLYSVLARDNDGPTMPHWHDAMRRYLREPPTPDHGSRTSAQVQTRTDDVGSLYGQLVERFKMRLRKLGQALGLIYRDDGTWRPIGVRRPPGR